MFTRRSYKNFAVKFNYSAPNLMQRGQAIIISEVGVYSSFQQFSHYKYNKINQKSSRKSYKVGL